MNNMFNCPPMCSKCSRLHHVNQPCFVSASTEKKPQSIITAAAYKYRTDGRIGILNAASIRGKGMVQLYAEDDIQWSWKGNIENFHFYWELVEPLRIQNDDAFWIQIDELNKDDN